MKRFFGKLNWGYYLCEKDSQKDYNRIMRKILLLVAISVAMIVSSCGGAATAEETLALVDRAIKSNDYEMASKLIAEVVEDDSSRFSAGEMTHLAIMAMKINDESAEYGDVVVALTLYERAMAVSADSVVEFANRLSMDEAQYLVTLQSLLRARDMDATDIPAYEEESIEEVK